MRTKIEAARHAIASGNDGIQRMGDADQARRIKDMQKQINSLEAANEALQAKQPSFKELSEEQRKVGKNKLAELLKKFSLVEQVVPKLPKIDERIDRIEDNYQHLTSLFPDLCMRVEMQTLIGQAKEEINVYVDMAMRQWDFEYRKGFEELKRKYE